MIRRGMRMWTVLPVHDMVHRRELLFQEGLEQHADVVGDYEIWPGGGSSTPRRTSARRWRTSGRRR